MSGHPPAPDEPELRAVLGRFATGLTVVSAGCERPHGMTLNAFSSVSLDPPLVLVCVLRTARTHAAICAAGSFAVSVLDSGQEGLARYFAASQRPEGSRQFDVAPWRAGRHTGAPLLDGALAWLECSCVAEYPGGDHTIFLGKVLFASSAAGEPLLFLDGTMRPAGSATPALGRIP